MKRAECVFGWVDLQRACVCTPWSETVSALWLKLKPEVMKNEGFNPGKEFIEKKWEEFCLIQCE